MMKKLSLLLLFTIANCLFSYAQDGPFKFDGKTDVLLGNLNHWKATQDASSNLLWTSWSTRYIMINNTSFQQNGNIGIGLTNPDVKLHVNAGAIKLTDPTGYPFGINMDMTFTGPWSREYSISYGGTNKMMAMGVYATSNNLTYAYIGGNTTNTTGFDTPWMVFKPDGNVGIGIKNPTYKLVVEGTIGARKVKVTQETWADFVFDPAYELPSLQYVEQFIKDHRHLPDVPSAKEVEKEGLDLGEMNKKLLLKVEELTLHMINQNKVSEIQAQKIMYLEAEIQKLKSK